MHWSLLGGVLCLGLILLSVALNGPNIGRRLPPLLAGLSSGARSGNLERSRAFFTSDVFYSDYLLRW